jgi:predicted dehydrogenase
MMAMGPGYSAAGAGDAVRVGVIGCGYWGPNHIRTFLSLYGEGARMVMAADPDPERRQHVLNAFPSITVAEDAHQVISNPDIDAVVLATPAHMHFEQARQALEAGKHVLVEKPLTTNLQEARELASLAASHDRVLMVGHTFQYTGAVDYIHSVVDRGLLGRLTQIRSLRLNLGLFRKDIDVLWDLAPHDLSILLHVLGRLPQTVRASGRSRVNPSVYDIADLTLGFGDGLEAHIIVSWLDPQKVRQMTIVGDHKMLVYDDMSDSGKIQIFDSRIEKQDERLDTENLEYSYLRGDILTPTLDRTEPLMTECRHFIECIRLGKTPDSGPGSGAAVTAIIETAQRSIRHGGKTLALDMFDGASSIADWIVTSPTADLQAAHTTTGAPRSPRSGSDIRRKTRFKAMVIDSDESRRLFAANALTAFEPGFDVVTVSDVKGAHEWMQSFVPDLLVVSETIGRDATKELIDVVSRSSNDHRCRVVSVGHTGTSTGVMAPWHHIALDEGAGLSEWLDAVQQLFEVG